MGQTLAGLPDPDRLAFADQDLAAWIAHAPQSVKDCVEREQIRRGGLRAFVPLAWHTVEGVPYQGGWHIDAVLEHIEAVINGEILRLIIMMPPRHMKSMAIAVMAPAYSWIVNPSFQWLFASYSFTLAVRDSRKCRMVIQSPWFKRLYGDRFHLMGDQNAKVRFANNFHGQRLSTSVGGVLTGEGGDFLVCDDPANVLKAESEKDREKVIRWWDESMPTRLNDPKTGRKILVQQRVHENDLAGHVLRADRDNEADLRENWVTLCLPAEYDPQHTYVYAKDPRTVPGELLWPGRFGVREIGRLKIALGRYASEAQLQQNPAPREGGFFKRDWFVPWTDPIPPDMQWVRGWDLAASTKKVVKSDPDYTASVLIGWSPSKRLWIIGDAHHFRADSGEVRRRIARTGRNDSKLYGSTSVRIEIPQDPGAGGKASAQDIIRELAGYRAKASVVTGEKGVRAEPLAAQAEQGNIHYLAGAAHEKWNTEFFQEMCAFPTASHDDYVDAATIAFARLTGGRKGIMDFYAAQLQERMDEEKKPAPVARGPNAGYGERNIRQTDDMSLPGGDSDFDDLDDE